jgi:multidrug efflux pump subunit AcrA (membrane-fusion protein)
MRFLRQSLAGLFLLAMTGALLVYAGSLVNGAVQARMSEEPAPSRSRERVFTVTVIPAEVVSVDPVLTAFGQIASARTLDLRAGAAGTIVEMSGGFVEGGQVRSGEVLLRIDPAEAKSALERALSDLLDAQREAREAERAIGLARDELAAAREQVALRTSAFERQEDLAARGVGTSAAVESAELAASSARQSVLTRRQALASAEARIEQAQTRISRAELAAADAQRRLDNTELTSEFDGVLTDVTVSRGGLVTANERVGRLIDPAAAGRLTRDSAAVGEGQSGRLVFAALDAAPGFKQGDFVRVEVTEPPLRGVIRVPAAAYGADGKVLVLTEDERLEAIDVQLMRRQGDDVLIRARGLNGREIVSARTPLLGAGIRVKPLRGSEATEIAEPEMVTLTPERRAKIVAFVEGNTRMPDQAKQRILSALEEDAVPAAMVQRIEGRMGG